MNRLYFIHTKRFCQALGSERLIVSEQGLHGVKGLEATRLNVIDPHSYCRSKRLESISIFCFPLLYKSKPLAENLAGVLVTTTRDQLFDHVGLMIGKNIACRRQRLSLAQGHGRLCQCNQPRSHYACANAYSTAVGNARGKVLGFGRVASQPRQASQIARGIALCAVR